jgi:cell division topological specificity factor
MMFKDLFKSMGLTVSSENKQSKDIAKERLKLVLMHERVSLSPEQFAKMKDEIIGVISKYLEIDMRDTDVSVQNEDTSTAFILNAKIIKAKQ